MTLWWRKTKEGRWLSRGISSTRHVVCVMRNQISIKWSLKRNMIILGIFDSHHSTRTKPPIFELRGCLWVRIIFEGQKPLCSRPIFWLRNRILSVNLCLRLIIFPFSYINIMDIKLDKNNRKSKVYVMLIKLNVNK